jgi:hypothetical protein
MRRQSMLLVAPRQLEWVTEELPPLRPNEVLVWYERNEHPTN